MISWIKHKIMFVKFCISRSIGYISIINSGMILFLFLSLLKEKGYITLNVGNYFVLIFTLGFILLAVLGWLEVNVIEAQREEATIAFQKNPMMMELREKIVYLYDVVKQIEDTDKKRIKNIEIKENDDRLKKLEEDTEEIIKNEKQRI